MEENGTYSWKPDGGYQAPPNPPKVKNPVNGSKVAKFVLLGVLLALAGAVTAAAVLGQTGTAFTPDFSCAAPSWGLLTYTAFLLIPAVLRTKEAIKWHISRSKI